MQKFRAFSAPKAALTLTTLSSRGVQHDWEEGGEGLMRSTDKEVAAPSLGYSMNVHSFNQLSEYLRHRRDCVVGRSGIVTKTDPVPPHRGRTGDHKPKVNKTF